MHLVEGQIDPADEELVKASNSSSLQSLNHEEEPSTSIIEQISKKIRLDKEVLALCLIAGN